ncbi:MAG: 23S rRNA (adenine(2503)-C(2))-methyltransferase RlmN [Rickettsiales bacterium]
MKQSLIGYSFEEIAAILKDLGEKPYRATQLWYWIYNQGVRSFDEMTNISKEFRARLAELYTLERTEITKELISFDETRKWLMKFPDGNEVETVYIPEEDRGTVCISSQVGCTLTCKFCHTGTQLLVRNLEPREIVAQFMIAKDSLNDWPATKLNRRVTNIVMMGMGEPLFNYENVSKALLIIMDGGGLSLSKRKITLSTSGVVPLIERCGQDLGVNLAISLHGVTNEIRSKIMPINNKYKLEELIEACRNYPGLDHNGRKVTFEYVMLKDVNDSDADARGLIELIRGIPSKINLIPFNPWPGTDFECSSPERIRKFASIIQNAGYMSPIRKTRGQDILAACGQLKSESQRLKKAA